MKIEIHKSMLPASVTAVETETGWLVRFPYDSVWNRIARQHDAVWQEDRRAWLIADPRPLLQAFWEDELNVKLARTMTSAAYEAEKYLETLPLTRCHRDWTQLADIPQDGEVEMEGYEAGGGYYRGRWSITDRNQVEYYRTNDESGADLRRGTVDWKTGLRVRQAITLLNLRSQVRSPPQEPREPRRKRRS